MRVVLMGSPDFAVPSLDALVEARFDLPLIVTQPDRRAGRGRNFEETALKKASRRHGLDVLDWGAGDNELVTARVLSLEPDAIVVVAFGHILRRPLLEGPRLGCLNLHASLLPRWRGVSPVHYAIMHGDQWTGVSVMQMEAGVDTGPVLAQRAVGIDPDETAGELMARLAGLGADLMVTTLRGLSSGSLEHQPQNETGAVYAPKLNRSLSPIRWERPVTVVHNQIRGLQPWPGATTFLGERLVKITSARPYAMGTLAAEPGTVVAADDDGLRVACGEGVLLVTSLQNPGRVPMATAEFLRGCPVEPGVRLCS
ncbi:methionyl-tRNA formyltransferase [bacterium]|nr:methionyl-tRNA formyltransferase [bacterium]MBU1072848.1 methionyl-tRNA formyltransferase [bacterium]MBU1674938.1 methionyl-tRNA formyltransferase [bacterium]